MTQPRLVCIIGAESTGKTTLASAVTVLLPSKLASALNARPGTAAIL